MGQDRRHWEGLPHGFVQLIAVRQLVFQHVSHAEEPAFIVTVNNNR